LRVKSICEIKRLKYRIVVEGLYLLSLHYEGLDAQSDRLTWSMMIPMSNVDSRYDFRHEYDMTWRVLSHRMILGLKVCSPKMNQSLRTIKCDESCGDSP